MNVNTHNFAIALEHTRIALLKRKDDLLWEVVDSVDISGMEEADIPSAFAPFAKKWLKKASTLSVCLPSDVVEHHSQKNPTSNEKLFEKHDAISDQTHHIFTKTDTVFRYAIFEIEHINLTRDFLEKFGFSISQIGYCEVGLDMPAPIFFDYQQYKSTQTSKSSTSQMELAFDEKTETLAKTSPNNIPSLAQKPSYYRFLKIALAVFLLLLLLAFWWWRQPSEKIIVDPDITQQDPAITAPQTPENELEAGTPLDDIDSENGTQAENIFPSPDFNIIPRPTNHSTHVAEIEEGLSFLLVQLPDFTIVPRPDEHGGFSKPSETLTEVPQEIVASLILPTARPSTLNIPPPPPPLKLIGISGASRNPGALIQNENNQFQRVNVGDTIDDWKIKAISKKEVIITRSGRSETLTVPSD